MRKIRIVGSVALTALLIYLITYNNPMDSSVYEDNDATIELNNLITYSEIEAYRQSWEEKQDELVFSYSTAKAAEFTEHGNAHQLDYDYKIQVSNPNRLSNSWINENFLIGQCIENDWDVSSLSNVIDTEDLFRLYALNRDAHYRVKVLGERIHHIVYQEAYTKEVVRDVYLKMTQEEVRDIFGEPDFKVGDYELIGYLFDKFYIFLIGEDQVKEISIYRRDAIDYADLETLMQLWTEQETALLDALEITLPHYEFSYGVSAAEVYGYETAGVIIRTDLYDLTLELDLFRQHGALELDTLTNMDAILDIEVYRILIENMLMGESMDEGVDLGMAFQNAENLKYSPDKEKACYYKSDTVDDNYPCIYVIDLSKKEFIRELLVDPFYNKIYWHDERFLVYMGTTCSFIYDSDNNDVIPLPEELFGGEYAIKSIDDEGIDIIFECE